MKRGASNVKDEPMNSILLGEAKRLLGSSSKMQAIAVQQSAGFFSLILLEHIELNEYCYSKYYTVRHARKDALRTWKLDRLVQMISEYGLVGMDVRF